MTQGKQDDEKQMVITVLGMLTFSTQFPDYMYPGKKQMTAQVTGFLLHWWGMWTEIPILNVCVVCSPAYLSSKLAVVRSSFSLLLCAPSCKYIITTKLPLNKLFKNCTKSVSSTINIY